MTKVLITGATGNIGVEVINALQKMNSQIEIYAGVKDLNAGKLKLVNYKINFLRFDFTDCETYKPALTLCDILFLLRPPQISEVKKYFKPLFDTCMEVGIKHIVFLSVQGVEKSKIIPHAKIEKLIIESSINYTFLRPAYFMQNFTTNLRQDLIRNQRIYLPAGQAKFTIIDVEDIGNVAAKILTEVESHIDMRYELTNYELLTFQEMTNKLSQILNRRIKYVSPNLVQFYITKRKENFSRSYIFVLIILHFFPRFEKLPKTTDWVKIITRQEPKTFSEFVIANKHKFQ